MSRKPRKAKPGAAPEAAATETAAVGDTTATTTAGGVEVSGADQLPPDAAPTVEQADAKPSRRKVAATAEPEPSPTIGPGANVVYRAKAEHEHRSSTLTEMPAAIVELADDGSATLDICNGGFNYRRSGVQRDDIGETPRSWRPD